MGAMEDHELTLFDGYFLPKYFAKVREEIDNLEVFDDDVWITSYPRSGTTWIQETTWCIVNNVDLEAAKVDLNYRSPFLDYCFLFPMDGLKNATNVPAFMKNVLDMIRNAKRPRLIKTHLPWEFLPKQIRTFEKRPRVIHVMRNPKDACVSFFHQSKLLVNYTGSLESFIEAFLQNKIFYCPYEKIVLSFWKRRNEPNIYVTSYETMKCDLPGVINELCEFLNISLSSAQINQLVNHLNFDNMKGNAAVNHETLVEFSMDNGYCADASESFIREGKVGGSKAEMTSQQLAEFDQWIDVHFAGTGLKF